MSWRSCVPKKCSNQDINVLRFNVTEIVLPLGFADVIFRRERRPEILCGSQARSIKKLWLVPNLLTPRTCWWSPTVPSRKTFTVNPLLSPPLFRGGKLRSNPPPPPPTLLHPYSSQTINLDWSVKVYSGWKFILFLVFGRMNPNFMCLTLSTLRSSSVWRIATFFLLFEKAA